jgi:hypothetical protein
MNKLTEQYHPEKKEINNQNSNHIQNNNHNQNEHE